MTKEPGYWAYFELCRWETKIDPAIQSAYAISGDKWAGYETVESSRPKQGVNILLMKFDIYKIFNFIFLVVIYDCNNDSKVVMKATIM